MSKGQKPSVPGFRTSLPDKPTGIVESAAVTQAYLVGSVVVSVVFSVVLPPGAEVVVFVFVSVEVVVLPMTLPSLVCVVVVWVLSSVVPFWLPQPMVNTPSVVIRTNARKRFISVTFSKSWLSPLAPAGTIPVGASRKNRSTLRSCAASAPFTPWQSFVTASLENRPPDEFLRTGNKLVWTGLPHTTFHSRTPGQKPRGKCPRSKSTSTMTSTRPKPPLGP